MHSSIPFPLHTHLSRNYCSRLYKYTRYLVIGRHYFRFGYNREPLKKKVSRHKWSISKTHRAISLCRCEKLENFLFKIFAFSKVYNFLSFRNKPRLKIELFKVGQTSSKFFWKTFSNLYKSKAQRVLKIYLLRREILFRVVPSYIQILSLAHLSLNTLHNIFNVNRL